jgi:hypothetical protein
MERLFAQYMSLNGWNRISFHDDTRNLGIRHGITLLQRPVNLTIRCNNLRHSHFFNVDLKECEEIQKY